MLKQLWRHVGRQCRALSDNEIYACVYWINVGAGLLHVVPADAFLWCPLSGLLRKFCGSLS